MNVSILRCSLGSTQSSGLNLPSDGLAERDLPGDLARQVGDVEGLDRADAPIRRRSGATKWRRPRIPAASPCPGR